MHVLRLSLAAALAAATLASLPAAAQQDQAQCILAGRLSDGAWAPKFDAVQLLGADGRVVTAAAKSALGAVRQARIAEPALLARCDGNNPLLSGERLPPLAGKAEVPALTTGLVDVVGVAYPQLRAGDELVELRVRVPAERVVMLTR